MSNCTVFQKHIISIFQKKLKNIFSKFKKLLFGCFAFLKLIVFQFWLLDSYYWPKLLLVFNPVLFAHKVTKKFMMFGHMKIIHDIITFCITGNNSLVPKTLTRSRDFYSLIQWYFLAFIILFMHPTIHQCV